MFDQPQRLLTRADAHRSRATPWLLVSVLVAIGGCGSSEEFTPCGGDLQGEWNITGGAVEGAGDGCADTGMSGFLYFKEDGRYTLNANVSAWKRSASDPTCGFSTADAGYWTTDGASVCIAGTKAEVDAISCDGTIPFLSGGLRGAAEYCVDSNRLRLRTNTLLGLRFAAVIELTRR